ncbi:RHS repeat protein [Clostridium subterminale]|uniref:RHS repeat protein n=1 Tax=Clostridium subterminale TaxID=1550 RepID=A0ABN1KU62_CLOSU
MVYEEITNGSTIDKLVYNYGDSGLVGFTLNGAEYFYVRNAQSDIIGILDSNGTQVVSYTYDTWGKLISITGDKVLGEKNPYRYRGYRYDTETGYYYLQSRYYNPEIGRFLNADAFGGNVGALLSHNIFAYCNNNPVIAKDPSGFRTIYTQGEETAAMRRASYAAMNKFYTNKSSSILNNNSGFSYVKSGITGTLSAAADKVGNVVAGFIIKGKKVWKDLDYLTMGMYVEEFSGGAKFAKKGLGLVGTVGFALKSVKKSYDDEEYVGIVIDVGTAFAGFYAGQLLAAGAVAATKVGVPSQVSATGAFGLSVAAGVFIDKAANVMKDFIYGR